MKNLQITAYTQHFIRQQVMPGDICIDATMGNGNDTALLSRLAGEKGHVIAFDIQKQALEHTAERLLKDVIRSPYCVREKSSKAVRRKQYSTGRSMIIPVS